MRGCFQTGADVLLGRHRRWLKGARVGLLSHLAAVNRGGRLTADLLQAADFCRLAVLWGPEHGFFGAAAAGIGVEHTRHPRWRIPLLSLYGAYRRIAPRDLAGLDLLVCDLQDLGARPYTYVATLRYLMEAAAAAGKPLIVADRPIPLPCVVDGPLLQPELESFVGAVPAPMAYGMTPAETALWLNRKLGLKLDLRVAAMRGYCRQGGRAADWPPWIPPSPGIRSWETGYCYLATVFSEALPALEIGRGGNMAFQIFGAPWLRGARAVEWLASQGLPGVNFHVWDFPAMSSGRLLEGVRLTVTDAGRFRPVRTSLAIIDGLQRLFGRVRLWRRSRPVFFDKLYGSARPRQELLAGRGWREIVAAWSGASRGFRAERRGVLLYDE